jgi:dextranase
VTELLPTKATFAPGEPVEVEVRNAPAPLTVTLRQLDRLVAEVNVDAGTKIATFPPQPEGGYGVEADGVATALDVLANPLQRPRYGFVASYDAGRDVSGVLENVRRLHLNAVQFYDWMYRHAHLLPPQDDFEDALGQQVSLETVRKLVAGIHGAGSLPMGYAAVYAVGRDEWPEWEEHGLFHSDGSPWTLGEDFLWNVDPTSERWVAHFAEDLRAAHEQVGFAGFHLDQYGQPKYALRRDGSVVELEEAFGALLERLAAEVPRVRMIFNNVNDFPTWSTARATQDATYIEVWAPHVRLRHLAELVTRARAAGPDRAVILAAYLSSYKGDESGAAAAERLQHAVVLSHGGTVLLHGEEGAALTEAYYVSNHSLGPDAAAAARRCYDFAVRYGDLLFAPEAVDVTRTHVGGENQELRVAAPVPVATDCEAGSLWVRAVRTAQGLLVHLIDLSAQDDDLWDTPKRPAQVLEGARLEVERARVNAPRIDFADPDLSPALTRLEGSFDGRHDVFELPPFGPWALLLIRDDAA